ncbi:MAG: hypothetical protein ABRQ26_09535 [Syntrophomonadaceae bacterium]
MDTGLKDIILAIITCEHDRVDGGACPLFVAASPEEQQKLSLILARILAGTVHDLENGVYIITRH